MTLSVNDKGFTKGDISIIYHGEPEYKLYLIDNKEKNFREIDLFNEKHEITNDDIEISLKTHRLFV